MWILCNFRYVYLSFKVYVLFRNRKSENGLLDLRTCLYSHIGWYTNASSCWHKNQVSVSEGALQEVKIASSWKSNIETNCIKFITDKNDSVTYIVGL